MCACVAGHQRGPAEMEADPNMYPPFVGAIVEAEILESFKMRVIGAYDIMQDSI